MKIKTIGILILCLVILGLFKNVILLVNYEHYNNAYKKPNNSVYIINLNKIQNYHTKLNDDNRNGIAGQVSSGTNFIYKNLNLNCQYHIDREFKFFNNKLVTKSGQTFLNKHTFLHYILKNNQQINLFNDNEKNIIVTMVRDPLLWIKSLCTNSKSYLKINNKKTCMEDIEKSSIVIYHHKLLNFNQTLAKLVNKKANNYYMYENNKKLIKYFAEKQYTTISLPEAWNLYYNTYKDLSIRINENPLIVFVRNEDMLFKPKEVISKLCNEFNRNTLKRNLTIDKVEIYKDNAKPLHFKVNESLNYAQIKAKYSDPTYRYKGFSNKSLNYLNNHVDKDLLSFFRYPAISF